MKNTREVSTLCRMCPQNCGMVVTVADGEPIRLKGSKSHPFNKGWLCAKGRRALDFFYSTYPDDQIKRIILSGGGANIAEFRELLAVEASAEVETINPFKNIYVDDSRNDPEFIKQVGPQAAITTGLAMRKVNDK